MIFEEVKKELESKGEKNITFLKSGIYRSSKRGKLNYWEVIDNKLYEIDSKDI